MKLRTRLGLVLVASASGISFGAAAQAAPVPFTYLSQTRSVSASSSATGYARGGTSSSPITDVKNASQMAPDFSAFSGMADANSTIGAQNAQAEGTASQQSSLTSTGFTDSGSISSNTSFGNTNGGPVSSSSNSIFQINFKVTKAQSYTFSASMSGMTDPAEPSATLATISLTNKAGKNVFKPIESVKVDDFLLNGTLKAGTYLFTLDANTMSNDANYNLINYSVSLTDRPTNGAAGGASGGSGVSSAVPLPSSGLAAGTMLAAMSAFGLIRRRVRGWVRTSMI